MRIKIIFTIIWFSLASFYLPQQEEWQAAKQEQWFKELLAKCYEFELPLDYSVLKYRGDEFISYGSLPLFTDFYIAIHKNKKIEYGKFPIALPSEVQNVVNKKFERSPQSSENSIRLFTSIPRLPSVGFYLGAVNKKGKNPIIIYTETTDYRSKRLIKLAVFNEKGKCLKIQPFGMVSSCQGIDATLHQDMSVRYTSFSCKIEVDSNGVATGNKLENFSVDSAIVQLVKLPKNSK